MHDILTGTIHEIKGNQSHSTAGIGMLDCNKEETLLSTFSWLINVKSHNAINSISKQLLLPLKLQTILARPSLHFR